MGLWSVSSASCPSKRLEASVQSHSILPSSLQCVSLSLAFGTLPPWDCTMVLSDTYLPTVLRGMVRNRQIPDDPWPTMTPCSLAHFIPGGQSGEENTQRWLKEGVDLGYSKLRSSRLEVSNQYHIHIFYLYITNICWFCASVGTAEKNDWKNNHRYNCYDIDNITHCQLLWGVYIISLYGL